MMRKKKWLQNQRGQWVGMRKLDWNEIVLLIYTGSSWVLIMLAPDFYSIVTSRYHNPSYVSYIEMMMRYGGEPVLRWVSFILMVFYLSLFWIKKYNYRIAVNVVGLIFYSVIGIAYILSYPNMMAGLIVPVGAWLWSEIFRLINEDAEMKKIARVEAEERRIDENIKIMKSEGIEDDGKELQL